MKSRFFCVSSIMVCFFAKAVAQQYPYLRFVNVKCEITYDDFQQMYYYSYTITNDSANDGKIFVFDVDISRDVASSIIDTIGLRFKNDFVEQVFRRHFPALQGRIVPVGFPQSPYGWYGSLSNALMADFHGDYIEPGATLNGNVMMSKGLPTIRKFVVKPSFDVDALFPSIEDTSADAMTTAEMDSIREAVNFRGQTIGPAAPPANFVALDFIDAIVSYKHQAFALGWIDNQGIVNSLDAKLDNAKQKLQQGNENAAINQLQAFINEVEAQKDKHLTSETYALLKFNAEYLIAKLEE